MPIDPNIVFNQQLPNMGQSVLSGINMARQIRQGPLLEALQQQQYAMGQQQLEQARQAQEMQQTKFNQGQAVQKAQYGNALAKQMLGMSPQERQAVISSQADTLRTLGVDPSRLDISDQGLQSIIQSTQPILGPEQVEKGVVLSPGQTLVGSQTGRTIATGGEKPLETRPLIKDLRSRVDNFTKDFKQIDAAYRKVSSASDNAVGDMSLVFGIMKLLDPGSTVREGEFATAEQARGVPDTVLNIYNKAIKGERLTPAQRQDFKQEAEKLFSAQRSASDESIADVLSQADQDGVPRVKVLGAKALREFEKRAADKVVNTKRLRFNPATGKLE